ncbi:hypothetical protein B0T24DRAFT_661280 [Lasiosphaeria ovina]|uniref:Uncharacterized protein n=1 Tax=Lasiosphaeria ovina TaxID=92902 RepID=A0AAE0TX26_9PEZI|nr:hypothetical protein B0T24DRAFT_661280 [Lasiosphaeria ovina]
MTGSGGPPYIRVCKEPRRDADADISCLISDLVVRNLNVPIAFLMSNFTHRFRLAFSTASNRAMHLIAPGRRVTHIRGRESKATRPASGLRQNEPSGGALSVGVDISTGEGPHHGANRSRNHNYDNNEVIAYIYPAVGTQGYLEAARSIDENAASPLYLGPRRRRPRAQVLNHLSCHHSNATPHSTFIGTKPWRSSSPPARFSLRARLKPTSQAGERATAPTAPSIDATALAALLRQIPSEPDHRAVQSYYPLPSRLSTVEPLEDEERKYEIKCY